MKRIVTAVDGSAGSMKAVDLAADLARTYGAELILVAVARHIAPTADPAIEEFARIEHVEAPVGDAGLAAAHAVLAGARIEAESKGVRVIISEPAMGDPAHEIITVAHDRQADMIVLGSRGYGRLAGLLVGSVAQKVLGHATCPVLVVR